ncbi:MAG TPA: hypothetical protein VG013_17030 [Gemmataceae bacterium]|jgi:hypothetical protein|nr:hypothetical protein [Gemmataceae bacterium]
MSAAPKAASPSVSPEEAERRLAEYRAQGLKHRTMPHIVYHDPNILCPWPGCGYRIAGIDFQLEQLNDPARYAQLLAAWWQGPGLAGRCPGCGRYVLFGMSGKQAVHDPAAAGLAILPDDWCQNGYLI